MDNYGVEFKNDLRAVIRELEGCYGSPDPPEATDPFGMVLWENVLYLADDVTRRAAFRALAERVGLELEAILAAPREALLQVTSTGGILSESRVDRLKRAAEIAIREFAGDVDSVLLLPPAKAKKALTKFPGIGEPGAEKILLFSRRLPVLALDSNGLRVLLRLGFGEQDSDYGRSYRSVKAALESQIPQDYDFLILAHQLLRQHGQETCKTNSPRCAICPLIEVCSYAACAPVAGSRSVTNS